MVIEYPLWVVIVWTLVRKGIVLREMDGAVPRGLGVNSSRTELEVDWIERALC
jgi:hypothetical protein